MANIQTWNGTATFSAGMTPFGFYDSDTEFQTDIIKVAKFCGQRLGYPLMDVELQSGSFFACFEEESSVEIPKTLSIGPTFAGKTKYKLATAPQTTTQVTVKIMIVERILERIHYQT